MDCSKHHPNGGASMHCDSRAIESLIANYQSSGDIKSLDAVIALTQERARALIKFRKTYRYRPEAELLSDVNCKLLHAVNKYDPAKGTAFTFVSQVIHNALCTSVTNIRRDSVRYQELTVRVLSRLAYKPEDRSAIDDIAHRIVVRAKTALDDELDLAVQRWLVRSFIADGFESRRHECANAALAVFSRLSHSRSRELYDLTMLEVRRVLYDDEARRRQVINPERVRGTRMRWMLRYATLMSREEFTKFFTLMRDLAPYLLLLIDSANSNRRQDRCRMIGRKNIELILNGDPDAVLLFAEGISCNKGPIKSDF